MPAVIGALAAVTPFFPLRADDTEKIPQSIEEVVVTAERREENIMHVPISVTAKTGTGLTDEGVFTVGDLGGHVPGVTNAPAPYGGSTSLSLSVRGIATPGASANADPTTGVYLDGLYFARTTGASIPFVDIAQTEVLKGPQGTLFGRNTIAGAVTITTQKPTDDYEGLLKWGIGKYEQVDGTVMANIPLLHDRLAVRLVYDRQQHDGYQYNSFLDQRSDSQQQDYVRATVLWTPADSFSFEHYFDYFTLSQHPNTPVLFALDPALTSPSNRAALAPYVTNGRDTSAGFNPLQTGYILDTIATASWTLPWATAKSITGYRRMSFSLPVDTDGVPASLADIRGAFAEQSQVSQEFQLYGKSPDDRIDWIAGLYYFHEDIPVDTGNGDPAITSSGTVYQYLRNGHNSSESVFGQVTYEIAQQLRVTGGARYVSDQRAISYKGELINPAGAIVCLGIPAAQNGGGCTYTPPHIGFHYVPWTVGLDYTVNDDAFLYVKISKGYRSGGFQQTASLNPATGQPFGPFGTENVVSYEAGTKFMMFEDRVRLTAAGYVTKYADMQQNIPAINPLTGVGAFRFINAGAATLYGGEFEATALLGQLRLNGALGLVNGVFDSGPYRQAPFIANRTPSKTTVSLGIEYPITTSVGLLSMHADYAWQSRFQFYTTYNLNTNPPSFYTASQIAMFTQEGYGLLNGRATLSFDRNLELSIWGRNLTGVLYQVRPLPFYSNGYNTTYYGDPLTFGATISYKI